ncbi:mechanosensitive ion channel family protein [Bacteroides sp. 214]|uniref:mechanosensitive ion channel family protein n=1 Tax=Bacteroides sp. 214 TaxID=2302935 RepID=UPI0013D094AB|nr:mechanosensitive ion channel domain-containing protein [Bacteroides sp. 214]NDW13685.1 mechanosensitive ion channel family protein [Bacteroides sp. 214]
MNNVIEKLNELLTSLGIGTSTVDGLDRFIVLLVVIGLAFLVQKLAKNTIMRAISKLVKKTKATWDDIIFDSNVMKKFFVLITPIIVYLFAPAIYQGESLDLVLRICMAFIIIMVARLVASFLGALYNVYSTQEKYKDRPLKGLLQTVQIVLYFIAAILMLATLMEKSALGLLTGLGASAAVLMLVFQDSILGFVSGIQLSANNMLRVGDWIEVPKYGVDGDVLEVTLNTVKVQNWDKTIVTIPPTLLMKESFKNWRGMQESGGRRVKRSVFIDMNSVHFCTQEMLDRFNKIQMVSDYIDEKEKALASYNKEYDIDNSVVVNGRRQTNLGIFRAYLVNYLKNHPSVNHDMTCMVRQLQPTEMGMPLELYFFTATTAWAEYEGIQADIFDHILASVTYFDLNVFQNPAGRDLRGLKN